MKLRYFLEKYRWDSSDPDRAPPPLPLNPGSSSPAAKPNTSATIAAAAEALAARARESAYTVNPPPSKSPEKSLIKGQYHKRMQSLQNGNGNVRDRSSFLEGTSSVETSPERVPRTPGLGYESRFPDRSPTRSGTATPTSAAIDFGRDTPVLRPTARSPIKAILGENTPPSATMLAIQNMPTPRDTDSALSDITKISNPNVRSPQTYDVISSQILGLTTIATNLQREMAQLSRRSKDNATDLVSLKEATNTRDEDIRKSLRDVAAKLSSRLLEPVADQSSRSASRNRGGLYLDYKAHASPPSMSKSHSMPRITSPGNFGAPSDRDISPEIDGPAVIALSEKIFREMATSEKQDHVLSTLSELQSSFDELPKSKEADVAVVKKLEEILSLLKENDGSRALVRHKDNPPQLVLDFDPTPKPLATSSREISSRTNRDGDSGKQVVSEDLLKLLKKMKDSVAEGGGMTAEIKALVRELRGEVLGMGREIGRKLDQAESTKAQGRNDAQGPGREEIAKIVEDGLAELRSHMDEVIRERRRQSSSSSISRTTADSQEVYAAVKSALMEIPIPHQVALQQQGSGIEREEILEAVREAWETYKPEIELQNFGLERDEILQCLKEGLQQYQPREETKEIGGASYEEVLDAVREGLQHFKPPAPIETEASMTKDEILMTVRECLDNFEFPASNVGTVREPEMTREDVLDAVKEGLSLQAPINKEIEFNRDDLFEAVRAGLEGTRTPMGGVGEQVLDKMQDLLDGMRLEFKQYSTANGGDTEQVLDALKDGLEVLRADIESYVDRAADVTGKDEIIDTVKDGLDALRHDLENSIANVSRDPGQTNNGEMLDAMEKEFEHLRQTIASSMLHSESPSDGKEEMLDAIRDGFESLKAVSRNGQSETETLLTMKDEFANLRETLSTTLVLGNASADKEETLNYIKEGFDTIRADLERKQDRPESIMSGTGEILDALNDGLETLRTDVEKIVNRPLDMTVNYEILDTLKEGLASVRADMDRLHETKSTTDELAGPRGGQVVLADGELDRDAESLRRNDIENLEIMITQLRIKVEALDNMPPPPPPPPASEPFEGAAVREDIDRIEVLLKDVQVSVAEVAQREQIREADVATKFDTEAIETLLRNTKAAIDEMASPESEGIARVAHLESVEGLVKETRDAIVDFGAENASKEDVGFLETLLREVRAGLDELREKAPSDDTEARVTKIDIETLETLCMDTKTKVAELVLPDVETLPTKADLEALGDLVTTFKAKAEDELDKTAQAFEARKIEHGGLFDKIEDMKVFVDDVREELKSKIKHGNHGIEDLAKTLDGLTETVVASDTTDAVKELMETITREFQGTGSLIAETRSETTQNHAAVLEKHEEHKSAIVGELISRIDSRFDEMMTKYDDAQLAAEEKEKAIEAKDIGQIGAINATRTVAEDLRLLVDTLGSSFTESCDRMGEDSKTVFNRMEDLSTKVDQLLSIDMTNEHQSTRAEVSRTLTGVEGVQAHVNEYQPKILEAVKDVLSIVGQHYEQAKTSAEEIKTSVNAIPSAIPLPAITAPLPSPELPKVMPVVEKYDDSAVHTKLDRLVEHATDISQADAHSAMLEKIQEQVSNVALEFNGFIVAQQARIMEGNEIHAKELEEAAIALQQRISQKGNVEADIVRLSGQKEDLANDVADLARVKDELLAQKVKLQADLSSLHTALDIRKEELTAMEARAEGLERRILDGVLDHSRSLLTTSRPSSLKSMNLKRVPSTASDATSKPRTSTVGTGTRLSSLTTSALSSGVGMALKRRPQLRSNPSNASSRGGDRRILSLSTLGANKSPERSMVLATHNPPPKSSGLGAGLKRSHSVKSNFPVRKTSWGGTKALGMYADNDEAVSEADKENSMIFDEQDEEDDDDGSSETGTQRRTSYSGTLDSLSYGDGGGSSVVSDRKPSYATSTVGTVGALAEEEEEEGTGYDALAAKGEISNAAEMIVFDGGHGSDSGLGTDLPTAALEGGAGGSDYFRMGDK
ncbi:MAG: hypothetical protein Q9195_004355 [Heterodermia aff. obscurata]